MLRLLSHARSRSPLLQNVVRVYSTSRPRQLRSKYLTATATLVVVGASGIWCLATVQDDVPLLTKLPGAEAISISSMSEREVTAMLSQEAYSCKPRWERGVDRYDGTRIAANTPCEDRYVHGRLPSPSNDRNAWLAWGIFDGHSGWQTAELLSSKLIPYVRTNLEQCNVSLHDHFAVQQAIRQGFVDLDNAIMSTALEAAQSQLPLQEKIRALAPAYAGSCALLSLYDPSKRTLHVACTGDARAVLGQKSADGSWKAIPLSIDQNGDNADEISRLHKEHPGEDGLVKNGRVLGLMTSRAFGDGQWKLPATTLSDFTTLYRTPGPLTPQYPVLTPPYLTAEPVVTTTELPATQSFLILASDGLWFSMSDQNAVDAVGYWLDRDRVAEKPSSVHNGLNFSSPGVPWKYADECLTVEDSNAAVHLARNALGGRNRELVAARLAYWPPRRIRDDITVQVVFFDSV